MMIQVYKPGNRNFDYNGDYNLKPISTLLIVYSRFARSRSF